MIPRPIVMFLLTAAAALGGRPASAENNAALLDPALAAYVPVSARPSAGASYLAPDGAVRIGGAEHVRVIVLQFDALYQRTHPGSRFRFESKGTTSAVPLLTYGVTPFGAMGREIEPLEEKAFAKTVGAPPMEVKVAHAANDTSQHLATSLAVYVNRANPLKKLTMTQVARIFTIGNPGGDVSRWGQVGLPKAWTPRLIHPIGTPEFTGFGTYLQKNHFSGRPLAAFYETYPDTDSILARLAADPDGIAVAAIGRQTGAISQVTIAQDEAGPYRLGTPREIASGEYGLGRYLYFYLRRTPGEPLDPFVKEYMNMVLSREGQAIIAGQDKGYIPLSQTEVHAERAKLDL